MFWRIIPSFVTSHVRLASVIVFCNGPGYSDPNAPSQIDRLHKDLWRSTGDRMFRANAPHAVRRLLLAVLLLGNGTLSPSVAHAEVPGEQSLVQAREKCEKEVEAIGGSVSRWRSGTFLCVDLSACKLGRAEWETIHWPEDQFLLRVGKDSFSPSIAKSLEGKKVSVSLGVDDVVPSLADWDAVLAAKPIAGLQLNNVGLSFTVAQRICRRNDLTCLMVNDPMFDGRSLALVARNMPDMMDLRALDRCSVKGESLSEIGQLKKLEILCVECPALIGQETTSRWRGLIRLRGLRLSGSRLQNEALKEFCHLPALKTIEISQTPVSGDGVNSLQCLSDATIWVSDDIVGKDKIDMPAMKARGNGVSFHEDDSE